MVLPYLLFTLAISQTLAIWKKYGRKYLDSTGTR
nr:MAG TPA: WRKY DNA-binding domain protein [Caudoviricetes sp.]DAO86970.1 MAG TPA: WRKY DNA-binding domain protein [Caudoviricetes sp.]